MTSRLMGMWADDRGSQSPDLTGYPTIVGVHISDLLNLKSLRIQIDSFVRQIELPGMDALQLSTRTYIDNIYVYIYCIYTHIYMYVCLH